MDWIRVSILTSGEGIDPVSACLREFGVEQVEIVDDMESVREYLAQNTQYWDYIDESELLKNDGQPCVRFYLNDDWEAHARLDSIAQGLAALRQRAQGLDLGSLQILQDIVREEDWANNWKKFYHPMPVGERLLIVPAWEQINAEPPRVKLMLEPGLVFGTGEHQSTQLCLAELEKRVRPRDEILDLGCGSGILSIAGLLLGAKNAVAVDVDPNARKIAEENATLNGIDLAGYHVYIGDVVKDKHLQETLAGQCYDVVVANIVADVIIALSPLARQWMKPDGIFIASGIISERFEDVTRALAEAGFEVCGTNQRDGWVCVAAKARFADTLR